MMGAKLNDHFFLVAGLALLRAIDRGFSCRLDRVFVGYNKIIMCELAERKAFGKGHSENGGLDGAVKFHSPSVDS